MGGSSAPRCATSQIGPEGVDDLVSTLQTVADDLAEDLSTVRGAVHVADHARGEHVPGDDVGGLQEFGVGGGDDVCHGVACELREF